MVRLLHTSDWHLGRILHGTSLLEDQAHLLAELTRLIRDQRPDAVLVAGDVYDRAVPAPDAIALLDDTLATIVGELTTPVIMIAGNHDGPERLAFGSRLLTSRGLHLFGRITSSSAPVILDDAHGEVAVHALPYAEPATVRDVLGVDDITSHALAMTALTKSILEADPTRRKVLVAHAFVRGGVVGDSERPLSVGGASEIDAAALAGFSYVAMGHLHRAQAVGGDAVQYSGSLFPYSWSEADQAKTVTMVQLGASGLEGVERIPLSPRRNLRAVEGTLDDLVTKAAAGNPDDYLYVTLTDRGPVFDAMGKLRTRYPNVLHVVRKDVATASEHHRAPGEHKTLSDRELFARFFEDVTGDALDAPEAGALATLLEDVARHEREVES